MHNWTCLLVALAVGGVLLPVGAETVITPADPSWGTALAVNDEVVIDAGDRAVWTGTLTVKNGGSVTTRGNLSVSGATAINAGGTLTVASGTSCFAFAAGTIKGNVTVAAGAELKMNLTEAFQGASTTVFHLYGTLNCQVFRQRIDGGKFFFHDGSRVIGAGDAYGGLYAYNNSRVVFDGTVEIEPPVAGRNGYTFTVACCENAHVKFKGGIKANTSSQNTPKIVQVAATAAEGNASGTCPNAFIEIGPSAYNGTFDFKGSATFVSSAKIALANASPTFTVTTTGAELELVADKSVALANHAAVQQLPAITASATTVRLTGDGTVALRDAAPAFPIVFDGPALQIADGAPVALAAGSSVAAPTLVGVEGLAANTAATLFTGVDASFDVTKVSATAMSHGIVLGTPAAASFDGTSAVVTAGVAAYDADAWIEPFIRANALIWLDASDAANFEFKDNTFGLVAKWKDRSTYGRDATAYTVPKYSSTVYGTLGITNGVPALMMGEAGSGCDLKYTSMSLCSAFWVMSICQTNAAFFLGHSSYYRFHRGPSPMGAYCYNQSNALWKNGRIFCDGVEVADKFNTLVPTDRHVYSYVYATAYPSDYLTADRPSSITEFRNAGRELSELITFPTALSDADRQAIEAYLAAKWMGSNPTAAGTDGVYEFKGEFRINGSVDGAKDLVFRDGASIAVENPATDAAMLRTTGTVTLPANTALPVYVNAIQLMPGTYTVLEAAGGITSLASFNATADVGPGGTAAFSVSDGKLLLTVSASAGTTGLTWRPQSAADLGWNATSANWLHDDGVTYGGFVGFVPVLFDGNESVTGDIEVTGDFTVGPINVTGAKDYTFTGDGLLIGTEAVTFGGTGTVTLDGVSFGNQEIVITNGQKVVLGFAAAENSLGTDSGADGGKVTVAGGGQLNINYTEAISGATSPRAEITHHKTFAIAGDGPDGRGALINDALDGRGVFNPYGPQFRRIELLDDATVGGTHRMEVRARTGTYATATPGIYGPGKRLTIKSDNPYGFGLVQLPIDVLGVTVAQGAIFRPESVPEASISVSDGITLDGGALQGYSTTYPATVPIKVTANGGAVNATSGTATFKGPTSVPSGSTLILGGSSTAVFSGAFTNAGTLSVTGGTHHLRGPYVGNMPDIFGGTLYFGNGFEAETVNLTKSKGVSGFYMTTTTAPRFTTMNINSLDDYLHARPQAVGEVDFGGTINITQPKGNFWVYGPTNGDYGVAMKIVGSMYQMGIAISSCRAGTLRLKSGTDLTTQYLQTGAQGSRPGRGKLIVDPNAKVTVTTALRNGRMDTASALVANHTMDIYGEVDASAASEVMYNPHSSPRAELYVHEGGVLKVKGITTSSTSGFSYGSGAGPANGRAWMELDGGRFELGSGGLQGTRYPGVSKYDFRDGTFASTASWNTAPGFLAFFGYEALGGNVTFDMGAYDVDWNTGLAGSSDITFTGSGDFRGMRAAEHVQGALLGKLTVASTGSNDLRVASYFGGGLSLAAGVKATVAKYSDEHYSLTMGGDYMPNMATNAWSFPYVSSDFWTAAHTYWASSNIPWPTKMSFSGLGEFYVPAEKAGMWTFAGAYDDKIRFDVDGTNLVTGSSTVGRGVIELAEGWHTFVLSEYNNTGGVGPNYSGFTNGKAVGFIIGESTSTAGADYTKFGPGASLGDGLALQVRPKANACVWKWQNTNTVWETTENWDHIKCLDSVAYMHLTGANQAADTLGYFGTKKASSFQGWFKVENGQEGEWTFKMAYDDYHLLKIDGVQIIGRANSSETVTGKVRLSLGWHRWEARVGDNTGAWGPRTYNGGNTLSYIAPGEAVKQFNETNLKLAATLGDIAVLEPTGIYKDLELGAGSTLTSSGTMPMPIFGTLKGTGTLAGAWSFAGDTNCWEVTDAVATRADLSAATFANATATTFEGLKSVRVAFNGKPTRSSYYLTGVVNGLAAAPAATVYVTDGVNDYSDKFSLAVKDGRLVLSNSAPAGFLIVIQ